MVFRLITKQPKDDNEGFPTLLTEPWRVTELLEKESLIQRYRLFKSIFFSRIVLAIMAFWLFNNNNILALSTPAILGFYLLMVSASFLYVRSNIEHITLYSFFIGLFDVALLGFLFIHSQDKIELSFLFFSILLSAMVLPLSRLITIIIIAYAIITLGWNTFPFKSLSEIISSPNTFDWSILRKSIENLKSQNTSILVLGFALLAVIVNRLALWSFANDVQARFRHKQMRQVLAYNRAIIEHLKTGVITLNTNGKIISINRHAIDLLSLKTNRPITELSNLSQQLQQYFQAWLTEGVEVTDSYRHSSKSEEVSINFTRFEGSQNLIMMNIESINDAFKRANEAKLNSLGRLTASIAHEIRNPLASINTATQLLSESAITPQQTQLTNIVLKNITRTDQIITDILSLFKETKPIRDKFDIKEVLESFCQEFTTSNQDQNFSLRVSITLKKPLYVSFDLGQFNQVLWNLCQNSLKYAKATDLAIIINYHLSECGRMLLIDFNDNGVGIPKKKQPYLFEPFYTGSSEGSGLGLYLVRELCNANNANIYYLPLSERETQPTFSKGACFRLSTLAYFSEKKSTDAT